MTTMRSDEPDTVVYDFSGAPPEGAIDGTEELLPDAEQAALRDWYATHPRPKPFYQRIGGRPPGKP